MTTETTRQSIPDWEGLRIAILGIGNEMHGDDAAGILVVQRLAEKYPLYNYPVAHQIGEQMVDTFSLPILIIKAGPAPENFSGILRRFRPDWVIFIDAAEMEKSPGSISWVKVEDLSEFGGSTHTLSPSLLASFIINELHCKIIFIGIQPANLQFGQKVSQLVVNAVDQVVLEIGQKLFPINKIANIF